MRRLFPVLLVVPLLALFSQQSRAENEIYGGVGAGYSTFKINSINFEAAEFATREFLGLRYGDYMGIELGYINFGKAEDQIAIQPGVPSANASVDTGGFDLSLVGRYPLDDGLAAFAKLGAIKWDATKSVNAFPGSEDDNGTDMIWGLGLDFRGSDRFHIRVEAEFVDIEFASSWWVLTTSVIYGIPFAR